MLTAVSYESYQTKVCRLLITAEENELRAFHRLKLGVPLGTDLSIFIFH